MPLRNDDALETAIPASPTLPPSLAQWDATDSPVYEPIKWMTATLAVVFGAFLVGNFFRMDHPGVRTVMVVDSISIVVSLLGWLLLVRRPLRASLAHPILAILVWLAVGNTTLSGIIYKSPWDFGYIAFMLIAIGAMALSPAWMLGTAAVSVAISVTAAALTLPTSALFDYAMTGIIGFAMMVSIFLGRYRSHRRMAALREVDRGLANSLSEALRRSEQRLHDQQQTEQRRQALEDQLRQSQKLEAIGTLAGGVAHDMNNVLGAITSIASLALERIEPESPLRQDVEEILTAARRGGALTRNLLGFARQGLHRRERFRLEATVDSIRRLLTRTISKQIEFTSTIAPELNDAIGDPGQLSHVLMNLCINAVDAMHGCGTLDVSVTMRQIDRETASRHEIAEGAYLELCVADTGEGISPHVLPRVFEPFFSTKSSTERSGLGLSMVYGTVRDHGGAVWIDSRPGDGTRVYLWLPSEPAKPATVAPPQPAVVRPVGARTRILIVDDEPLLRSAARRTVASIGFEPILAAQGAEAVALFRHQHESIALVLLDIAMPVMGGRDCFFELGAIDPGVPVLITSGYANNGEVEELLASGALGNLSKPYDHKQLIMAISRSLSLTPTGPTSSNRVPVGSPLSEPRLLAWH